MEFAFGVLYWSTSQFWESTPHELMAANHGYLRANKIPDKNSGALTRDEFETMKSNVEKIKAEKIKANKKVS